MAKKKKSKTKVSKKKKKVSKKKVTKKTTKKKKTTSKKVTKKKAAKKKSTGKKATKKKASQTKAPTQKKSQKPSKTLKGKKAPSLLGTATGGKSIDIANWGHPLVLFFYPKDFTPGCTVESKDFSTRYEDFKKLGVDVIGVSPDTLSSHEKFRDKEGLREDLISDPDKVLCEAFGVIKEKNLYGRKYMGVERSTFVLDKNGVVVQEWRGVKVPGHVDEVYQFVKENREQLL